jgi:hypothetical protein
MVRAAAASLALSALALYALAFAPWFKHQYYGTPRERLLEDSDGLFLRLNGWELYDTPLLTGLILAAVFAGLGAGAWLVYRHGDRAGIAACLFALLAAVAALVRIADELRAPSDENYPHPEWGIYAALSASVALVVGGLVATVVVALTARSRMKVRTVWPIVVGAAVVYALTVTASEGNVWIPETIALCPLAGAFGYLGGRWWLPVLPIPLAVLYVELAGVKGLGVLVLLSVGVLVTGAVIAGVLAKAAQRRLAAAEPSLP